MRVHVASLRLGDAEDLPVGQFRALAAIDRAGEHRLTDEPESADLILFPQCHMRPNDWRLEAIRSHPLALAFPEKVMVYDERDRPWCALPGVYVSMPARRFDDRYQRAWSYAGFARMPAASCVGEPDLLFSLVASSTHRCRTTLFGLREGDSVIEEVRRFVFYDPASDDFESRRAHFMNTLARSRFVLCPRGRGTSSIRLYEALAAGRVPVIISDEWVPPKGPNWESFSIRWPERQTDGLVTALRERDGDWTELSTAARAAYSQFFAPEIMFDQIVSRCADLRPAQPAFSKRSPFLDEDALSAGAALVASRLTVRARRFARGLLDRLGLGEATRPSSRGT